MNCPRCEAFVFDDATACETCGGVLADEPAPRRLRTRAPKPVARGSRKPKKGTVKTSPARQVVGFTLVLALGGALGAAAVLYGRTSPPILAGSSPSPAKVATPTPNPVRPSNALHTPKPSRPRVVPGKVYNTLIVPGVSVGAIRLGKPVPPWFFNQMGQPDRPVGRPDAHAWGGVANSGITGFLQIVYVPKTGAVSAIRLSTIEQDLRRRPRFATREGIHLDSPFADVRRAFPDGVRGMGMDADFTWELPRQGTTIGLLSDRVAWMDFESPRGGQLAAASTPATSETVDERLRRAVTAVSPSSSAELAGAMVKVRWNPGLPPEAATQAIASEAAKIVPAVMAEFTAAGPFAPSVIVYACGDVATGSGVKTDVQMCSIMFAASTAQKIPWDTISPEELSRRADIVWWNANWIHRRPPAYILYHSGDDR